MRENVGEAVSPSLTLSDSGGNSGQETADKKCECGGHGKQGLNRMFFVVIGTLFVGLAYLSIMIPVLPQSPFLLIALVSYSRSSKKLETWLLNNRLLGKHLRKIRQGGLGLGKISKNPRFLGIMIIKVSILAMVLFHIFGLTGLLFTLMIVAGKLALFSAAFYISGRIWSTPIRES